ncbi:MAG: hypothetical protein H6719_06080 [Sandaracinaceae bacterium]|nr:hypothetical protein [Sandaracinaceae bacterium]
MPRALLLVALLLPAAPAAAQTYDSGFRFGLGLDYGGLAGRGDGGVGGLRLTAGARVHDNVAVYWQGQALGGAFVEPERVIGVFQGWNSVLVEADVGIFQLAAGPSFDASLLCNVDTGQGGGLTSCADRFAPGLATRAGVRFGIFALSGDVHVTFDELAGPQVWVLAGVGIQLGDTASEPMRFPSTDDTDDLSEDPPLEVEEAPIEITRRPMIAEAEPTARSIGRLLDDPRHPSDALLPSHVLPARAEPRVEVEPERSAAPVVRRFSPRDVEDGATRPSLSPAQARPSRPTQPDVRDDLELEDSDDPIDGLEGF